MKAVVEIDTTTLQARQLLNYIEVLPFTKIRVEKSKSTNVWEEAVAEGAVTPNEFHAMLENEITNKW